MHRAAALAVMPFALAGCASGGEQRGLDAQRGVFHNPYGHPAFFVTNATTEHPPYIICNGDRCVYLDSDGDYTRMSDDERRDWRARIRLSEQNRRQNEGELFPPPGPPEERETDGDADLKSVPPPIEAGRAVPD